MELSADLNRVLKYGVAPADEVMAMAAAAKGQQVHNDTHHDHIFADKLADHSDPRELIVRRHLQRTTDRYRVSDLLDTHDLRKSLGLGDGEAPALDRQKTVDLRLKDSRLRLLHYTDPADRNKRAVAASWYVAYPDSQDGYPNRLYEAMMTPEEADRLLTGLGHSWRAESDS